MVRLNASEEFVLADIPGLIEGAHEGVGLGDRFLGHVERCAVLLHLVDGSQPDPAGAWRTVREELEHYGQGLAEKPELLCLNKVDAMTPQARVQPGQGAGTRGRRAGHADLRRDRRAGAAGPARPGQHRRQGPHRARRAYAPAPASTVPCKDGASAPSSPLDFKK